MHIEVEPGIHCFVESVGQGPPVVLLHGWGLDHRVWDRPVRALAEAGYSAHTIDLRGHGKSDRPFGEYSVARLGHDVVAVLERLDLTDVVLVGWSLGGLTAFRVAAHHGERLRRLVLVASNGVATARKPGYPFGAPAEAYQDAVIALEKTDRIASRRQLIRGGFRPGHDDALSEHLLELTMRTPSWAGAACLATLMETDQVQDVSRIGVPVAQILGDSDPLHSERGAAWLDDQLAGGTHRHVLEDCGHYPMFEAADAFEAALLAAVAGTAETGTYPPAAARARA